MILIICNLDFCKYKRPKFFLKIIISKTIKYNQSKIHNIKQLLTILLIFSIQTSKPLYYSLYNFTKISKTPKIILLPLIPLINF